MIECQKSPLKGHCEPVTDVYFVAIPAIHRKTVFFVPKMLKNPGDSHASVRYFFGMTCFLTDLSEVKGAAKTSKPNASAYRWYGSVRFAQ